MYKRFHSADGISFTPSSRIDSVFSTGDSIVAGVTYEKFQHKVYVSGVFSEPESILELLRVDPNGHLVNPAGFVYHPGYEPDFTAVREYYVSYNLLGNIHYESGPQTSVVVEGNTYSVYPYVGITFRSIPRNPSNTFSITINPVWDWSTSIAAPFRERVVMKTGSFRIRSINKR